MSKRTEDTPSPERLLVQLALGRIFRLGSRPSQEGDIEQYEEARAIIMQYGEKTNSSEGHNDNCDWGVPR